MTTVKTPHDLLAAVPFLIGYHPTNSLVLISIKSDALEMAMRIDFPINPPEGYAIPLYSPQNQNSSKKKGNKNKCYKSLLLKYY